MQVSAGLLASPAPLYYERLVPARSRGDPLVLVHGGFHTGACYRCTPDSRPGWAHDFTAQELEVVIPDLPGHGRSGYVPTDQISGELIVAALRALLEHIGRPVTLLIHSMGGPWGFRLLETAPALVKRLVAIAPGPPGNLQPLATIIAETDEMVEARAAGLVLSWRIPKRGAVLPDEQMVRAKLVGNSSRFPRAALNEYRASLAPLPPRLMYERLNVEGSQLHLADDVLLDGAPVLIVTGTHDVSHAREADEAIGCWLAQRGAAVDFVWLADRSIQGNGHMVMLENNSAEIAGLIGAWIRAVGG
jgi:pimeloyl-ACP methyl ester carboxylesterase